MSPAEAEAYLTAREFRLVPLASYVRPEKVVEKIVQRVVIKHSYRNHLDSYAKGYKAGQAAQEKS